MVTEASIKARFPSLSTAPTAVVDACIAEATTRTPSDVWGDLTDEGVQYLAAHLICIDPRGINARMVDKSGRTSYLAERERMARFVTAGLRVTGV